MTDIVTKEQMIERMARGVCEADTGSDWGDLTEADQQSYLYDAEAALDASGLWPVKVPADICPTLQGASEPEPCLFDIVKGYYRVAFAGDAAGDLAAQYLERLTASFTTRDDVIEELALDEDRRAHRYRSGGNGAAANHIEHFAARLRSHKGSAS